MALFPVQVNAGVGTKGIKQIHGKIDETKLAVALVGGASNAQAGREAGSLAKNPSDSVANKIRTSPKLKKTIIDLMEQRQRWLINSIKLKDIKSAPLAVRGILVGIITDKLQLLRGDPTQRIETIPKMVIQTTEKVSDNKLAVVSTPAPVNPQKKTPLSATSPQRASP